MKASQPTARNDTMLGVCQFLGEDLGIHPNILRVAFGVGLIVQPVAAIATYIGLAIVVAVSHWLFPHPRPAADVLDIRAPHAGGAQHQAHADVDAERVPQAA